MTMTTRLEEPASRVAREEVGSARRNARLVDVIPTLLRRVAGESDPEAGAWRVAEALVGELDALAAAVYFADADGQTLRLAASIDPAERAEPGLVDIDDPVLPVARAARTRALQLVGNVNAPRTRAPVALARAASGVVVAIPLVAGDHLLGVVSARLARGLEPAAVEALGSLGVVLGVVLDRARLEREARGRDEWTCMVVHELRQPLQSLALHAVAISRGAEVRSLSAATRMIEGINRLNRITDDLLEASLDISTVTLRRRPTDLVRLASGLVDAPDDEPARVRIVTRGEVPEINVDPARIEQILANLIGNALKYGLPGSAVEVLLECRAGEVVFSVTSAGNDIPERERSRVFERRYRGHRGAAGGWGLGLYVCRGLAEAHGGRISVVSGSGQTTFSVVLPLSPASR